MGSRARNFLPKWEKKFQDRHHLDKRTQVALDSVLQGKSCLEWRFGRFVPWGGHDGIPDAVELTADRKTEHG
jgi:hypothetical protein